MAGAWSRWGIAIALWWAGCACAVDASGAGGDAPIYLYTSPHTAHYLRSNETSYDPILGRWRKYLKRFGKRSRDISKDELLSLSVPGVLILASAQALDNDERRAIAAFSDRGGSVWGTWALGSRTPGGQFVGYDYLQQLFRVKVLGKYPVQTEWFLMPFGDGPLTWPIPAGRRISVGEITDDMLLRVRSDNLAAVFMDWMRTKDDMGPSGAIAFHETDVSRLVYFAFPERAWNYHKQSDWNAMLDSTMAWLLREPRVFKGAWPQGYHAAHLMEMDTEDKFFSAPAFAAHLESIGVRGTFYCLTSIALQYPQIVRDLLARGHEIAYHADVHFGFRDLDPIEQEMRIVNMQGQMKSILGEQVTQATGFRAPTESYDARTESILRKRGILHHAADPGATQDRLPFFSTSEPGLDPSQSLVVLPRTQFDDVNFTRLLYGPQRVIENLTHDLDLAVQSGAFSLLSVHTQNYVEGGLMAVTMADYMKKVSSYSDRLWVARGDHIAAWWRKRESVRIRTTGSEGRALRFSLASPTTMRLGGLSVIVTNPVRSAVPTVSQVNGTPIQVRIKLMDPYRTAIIFDEVQSNQEFLVRFH